jgi:chorismate-pyruvate lyase
VSKGAKLVYKPVGLVGGIVAGLISGMIFKQIWKRVADEEDAPKALQSEYSMREVVLAAAIQGAIFAATKAAIERAGARGFTKLTGAWPGD